MIILTDKTIVIPVGISPNYAGAGNSDIKIQASKDVTITENGSTTVVPDENFDVITQVNITTDVNPALEDKSVEITENGEYNYTASAPYYGIGNFNVKVNVPIESSKTVNPSFEEDVTVVPSEGFDAMSSVIVKKAEANLQDKTVDKASTSEIVLTADEGYQGLGTVTVAPIKTTSVTADPSTNVQEVNANTEENEYITSVTVNPVKTKSLSITPRIVEQTFTASEYLYNTVNVSAIKHTEKTYDSSTNTQTYDYVDNNYEFIEKLTINPVTSNIDPNIVPENIAKGVSILGVEGTVEKFQIENSKTVNPSFVEDVTVTPSEGFDAMSSVIVKKAEANLQDKTVDKASESQIVLTADEGYQGLGTVTIAPIKTTTHTVIPSSNQQLITADPNNNEYISEVLVNGVPQKTLTADPSTNEQTFNSNHSSGEFYSKVVVNPVTSSIDSNIVPNNIAKGVSILGVTGNLEAGSITPGTPTEAYAIRPTDGRIICILTNVLLSETTWVSVDFAMDAASLNKEKAYLFGISEISIQCYLNNGVLHVSTGEEVPMLKQITLDTNRHTIEFGFTSKVDESGHANFKVVFDGEVVADASALVPTNNGYYLFNVPLCLFGIARAYYESYDTYIALGGITRIVNGTGYAASSSAFDLFSLTVYDKPGYYRQTIHAYTPSVDANNKPIFIDNITGEYQYPASGTYSYAKIDGDTRTEIASATYTMPIKGSEPYFRPSEGAIVPTDIKLPALHRITMYVKDIDSFDEGTSQDALNNVKNRVMIGAQPVLVAPFNHIDYEKSLPRLPINDENTAILGDTSVGLFNQGFEVYSGYTYSIYSEYGGTKQAFASLKGEHTIKFGQRAHNINNIKTFFTLDDNQDECHTIRGIIQPDVITRVNERQMTPLCIFGTYNFVEGTKPDYVNSLGYQEALNQIGYTTGVRYAVKQIDIEEYPINSDDINTKGTLRHRLATYTDNSGVNCFFDTITGTTYYPYNGTLDVYTGPVEPEPPVPPTILTNTYIKPSEGAIVPTDIKFTSLTNVTLHAKGFDDFRDTSNLDSIAMIGAQPNFIVSPIIETYSSSNMGIYFNGGGNVLKSTNVTSPQKISRSKANLIRVGYKPMNPNNIIDAHRVIKKIINFNNKDNDVFKQINIDSSISIYKTLDNQMTTPICIFGNYNNPESMTPDDVIALGYENALNQIGYVTGTRYGLKQIDITVYNTDGSGSMTTTHSLVPARDTNGTICLYDTITEKSYYPFHGTLDII